MLASVVREEKINKRKLDWKRSKIVDYIITDTENPKKKSPITTRISKVSKVKNTWMAST